jgi:hypothetical protein
MDPVSFNPYSTGGVFHQNVTVAAHLLMVTEVNHLMPNDLKRCRVGNHLKIKINFKKYA